MAKKQRSGGSGRYRGRNNNSNNNNTRSGGGGGGGRGGRGGNRRRNNSYQQDSRGNEADYTESGDPLPLIPGSGVLEMHPNGYGFLRNPETNFTRERTDPFVPGTMIEKFGLREGLLLHGMVQRHRKQQGPRLRELLDVDGMAPEDYVNVKSFDELTPITPDQWFKLETGPQPISTRVMDLLTPLGKGQRALIVAPPRTGKTVLMQHISNAVSTNYPNVSMIMLLIDERPEEVTDMKRSVRGEVFASSLDNDVESHVRLAQLTVARCQRLSEMGKDVFMLMDSITDWLGRSTSGSATRAAQ